MPDIREIAAAEAQRRLGNVIRYNAELERLELTANVFDYEAVMGLLRGDALELPTEKDR